MLSLRVGLVLSALMIAATFGSTAQAQTTPAPVTVTVYNGSTTQSYQAAWAANMTALNAMEQALPGSGSSFSLSYYPGYLGYFITSVGGTTGDWFTCLLPVGPGSTSFMLPLGANRILVGPGDTVQLSYNQECASSGQHR